MSNHTAAETAWNLMKRGRSLKQCAIDLNVPMWWLDRAIWRYCSHMADKRAAAR